MCSISANLKLKLSLEFKSKLDLETETRAGTRSGIKNEKGTTRVRNQDYRYNKRLRLDLRVGNNNQSHDYGKKK